MIQQLASIDLSSSDLKSCAQKEKKKICIQIFREALFIIATKWRPPRCPSGFCFLIHSPYQICVHPGILCIYDLFLVDFVILEMSTSSRLPDSLTNNYSEFCPFFFISVKLVVMSQFHSNFGNLIFLSFYLSKSNKFVNFVDLFKETIFIFLDFLYYFSILYLPLICYFPHSATLVLVFYFLKV